VLASKVAGQRPAALFRRRFSGMDRVAAAWLGWHRLNCVVGPIGKNVEAGFAVRCVTRSVLAAGRALR